MSDDPKVLSKEEVDALLNLSRETSVDLDHIQAESKEEEQKWEEANCGINNKSLTNITDLNIAEAQKIFTTFLRKKITVLAKEHRFGTLAECLEGKMEKYIYTVYQVNPNTHYGMIAVNLAAVHHITNLLFGGQIVPSEEVIETPGKIGVDIAEKINQLGLESLVQACSEYGGINCEIVKSITHPGLTSKITMDDRVYSIVMTLSFGEVEGELLILTPEKFLSEFIPIKTVVDKQHMESNFWRAAVETQVADSIVEIHVNLADTAVRIKDFMALEAGDLLPISDPTLVYVCLNNLKLFRANAGQANSKRVVKIVGEV
jgi:flagellar motor switch protein FliM